MGRVFICVGSFVITCFIFLVVQTKSPVRDIFTNDRVSLLKDRSSSIERDIIVDMSGLCEPGGMMTLTQCLVTDIAKKRPNWRFLVLISEERSHIYKLPSFDNIKIIKVNFSPNSFAFIDRICDLKSFAQLHDKLIQLLYYDLIFCDRNCDLVWDPVGDASFCNFVSVPRISTIHDIACFDGDPKFFNTAVWPKSRLCIKNAIVFSKKIITISKFSQKKICEKFHVSKDFIKLIPTRLGSRLYSDNDPNICKNVLNKYNLHKKKYFIFCSSWWKHKNHANLIRAFNKFTQINSDIKLVLVGAHPNIFEFKPIKEYSSNRLIIVGFVPNEELSILLKNSLAFIHPSIYEGFGMPIIEAMNNGIPVACSNTASLPEIAGSAALMFDPLDVDHLIEVMLHLVKDSHLRESLIRKGYEQAKKYVDKDAMVNDYIHIMEEVMQESDKSRFQKNQIKNNKI